MAFKDILVHLDGGRGEAVRLQLATDLAQRHKAHLTGLYGVQSVPFSAVAAPGIGSYTEVETMQIAVTAARQEAADATAAAEAAFRAALAAAGIAGELRPVVGAPGEIALAARYADLVILGQTDPDAPANAGLPESVLTGAGRPVLLVPYVGKFAGLGKRVLIAWDATRAAARAVGDALPLLRDADAVTIVTIDPSGEGEANPAAQLVKHLARHNIKGEASTLVADDVGVGDLILSRAADLSADLIVMGGYDHSPTREFILGGATRSLLQHMTVPVLMSH